MTLALPSKQQEVSHIMQPKFDGEKFQLLATAYTYKYFPLCNDISLFFT